MDKCTGLKKSGEPCLRNARKGSNNCGMQHNGLVFEEKPRNKPANKVKNVNPISLANLKKGESPKRSGLSKSSSPDMKKLLNTLAQTNGPLCIKRMIDIALNAPVFDQQPNIETQRRALEFMITRFYGNTPILLDIQSKGEQLGVIFMPPPAPQVIAMEVNENGEEIDEDGNVIIEEVK